MGEAPRAITLESGVVAERDFSAEHNPRRAGAGWPMECIASGVNAYQAQDLRDFFAKHGENVEVTNDGNPVYTSLGQRKRLLKLRGFYDKSSY